jgi:hypothetical protein
MGGEVKGNWRMEWVASTLHTTSEHGVSSITTADAYTSAASSRQNWRPRWFKWTLPFRRKTKPGFCAYAISFQPASTSWSDMGCPESENGFNHDNELSLWFSLNTGANSVFAFVTMDKEHNVRSKWSQMWYTKIRILQNCTWLFVCLGILKRQYARTQLTYQTNYTCI